MRAGRRRVRARRRPRRGPPAAVARGMRHGVPLRRERGRASRTRPAAPRSRAEHDRHLRRAGGDARRRRHTHRVRLHRLGLRGARGVPHARDVPVPGADVALRRLEARGGRADPGLRARVRLRGDRLSLRLDPRRALHARARLRLLPEPAAGSRAPAGPRKRPPGEVVPLRRRLHLGDDARDRPAARAGHGGCLQPRNRRDHRGRRLDRDDHRAAGRQASSSSTWAECAAGPGTAR